MLYGLIGYPLTHSFSPAYFTKKFAGFGIDATYQAFPIQDIGQLKVLLATHPQLAGLNVTIPYKQAVIPYLHELDATAAKTQAVNCIDIQKGKLKGYNTDVTGFQRSLEPLLQPHHNAALILGSGGSARAVAWVLTNLHIPFIKVSRTGRSSAIAYPDLTKEIITDHPLIINCTPLGMHPEVNAAPDIPYHHLTDRHLLYDLVYNPEETLFLSKGRQHGTATKNGLEMLHLQADASWDIWSAALNPAS